MDVLKNLFSIAYKENGESKTVDIYQEYGAFLTETSSDGHSNYDALLAPPSMKPYIAVNFREEDGEKLPDELPLPRYEARDITLHFALIAEGKQEWIKNYSRFLALLKTGWLTLIVPELGREFCVYYKECSTFEQLSLLENGKTVSRFKIKFREPNPSNGLPITR